jgi:hypothetical protein
VAVTVTETTVLTPDPAAKPHLFAALAKLQADLPRVGKTETAQVRSDKGNYSYEYADLADVSAAILPLLGDLGLAFTAWPTLTPEGKFVLAYSLVHSSGERLDGQYPLTQVGSPQQVGGQITYARRYCLCAVTGIAPDKDDDGQAAEAAYRHNAAVNGDGARVSRPEGQQPRAGRGRQQAAPDLGDWGVSIDGITSQEDADRIDRDLKKMFQAKEIDAARANAIRDAIKAKAAQVTGRTPAGAVS